MVSRDFHSGVYLRSKTIRNGLSKPFAERHVVLIGAEFINTFLMEALNELSEVASQVLLTMVTAKPQKESSSKLDLNPDELKSIIAVFALLKKQRDKQGHPSGCFRTKESA